jgi:beta-glucosidase-like glycosyl hydrolase/poly-gamma-glutamate capsule biosynthesis protein CapA/YwtB (metallophosphatase superfamily)
VLALVISYTISLGVHFYNKAASYSVLPDGAVAEKPEVAVNTSQANAGAYYADSSGRVISNKTDIDSSAQGEDSAPPAVHKMRISAAGDLMLHSYQYENAFSAETGRYEFDSNFELVKPYLKQADIALANLETVFGGPGLPYSDYPRFNAPDSFGEAIKNAGFNMLTTANNHCNDKGDAAIMRTLNQLDFWGIKHTGTFRTKSERGKILTAEADGISVAFLSYTYGTNGLPLPDGKNYMVNIIDENLIISDLQKAKELNTDFIVVMPHLGNEYETAPRQVFKNWINLMLENGADIVLASHPHVLQPLEIVKMTDVNGGERTCAVAYSLGNFISGQRTVPRDEGVILNIELEKKEGEKAYISKISYVPTWVMFTNAQGQADVKVLPIGEILQKNAAGEETNVRGQDLTRMKAALKNIKKIMTGTEEPQINDEEFTGEYTAYDFNGIGTAENTPETETQTPKTEAEELLETLSIEEKIGQLFFCAFRNEGTEFTKNMRDFLERYKPAGVVLFSGEIGTKQQTINLIAKLKEHSEIPLIVATDEEGGRVSRIGKLFNGYIGPAGGTKTATEAAVRGFELGKRLGELGFNMNLAPVADINSNAQNKVIGDRAFSANPDTAAEYVAAFIEGIKSEGVLSVIKHFPGHGDTAEDSHNGMAVYKHDITRLFDTELKPFISGIVSGADAVMVGHISAPEITGNDIPATFSGEIVNGILRGDLEYNGLVMTDAMDMGAITNYYSPGEAAVAAIEAGIDIIVMPEKFDEAYNGVMNAYLEGRLSEERINESVMRVLNLKQIMNR